MPNFLCDDSLSQCNVQYPGSASEEAYLASLLTLLKNLKNEATVICRPESVANCKRNNDYVLDIDGQFWILDHSRITWPDSRMPEIQEYQKVLTEPLSKLGRKHSCYVVIMVTTPVSGVCKVRNQRYSEILNKTASILESNSVDSIQGKFHDLGKGISVQFNPVDMAKIPPHSNLALVGTSMSRDPSLLQNFIIDNGRVIRKKLISQINREAGTNLKVGLCLDQYGDDEPRSQPLMNTLIQPHLVYEGVETICREIEFDLDGLWLRKPDGVIERLK